MLYPWTTRRDWATFPLQPMYTQTMIKTKQLYVLAILFPNQVGMTWVWECNHFQKSNVESWWESCNLKSPSWKMKAQYSSHPCPLSYMQKIQNTSPWGIWIILSCAIDSSNEKLQYWQILPNVEEWPLLANKYMSSNSWFVACSQYCKMDHSESFHIRTIVPLSISLDLYFLSLQLTIVNWFGGGISHWSRKHLYTHLKILHGIEMKQQH